MRRLALAVVSCLVAGFARADGPPPVKDIVEPVVKALMARYDIPGMAVAVTTAGRTTVMNFGIASKASNAPVTDDTLFEIGSVSKTLTATLGAYAEASGKLALSDHPGRYVPLLKGRPIDRATLLHLGTYTPGGLPLQFPDSIVDEKAAMAWFRDWTPAVPPGTRREYSNPSLGLFGLVASRALGRDYATLMQTVVFPAFGMKNTYIDVPERAAANYAWGYRDDKPIRVTRGPMDQQIYGVKTSASDLLRFVQANLDPAALDATMRRAVELTHVGYFRAGPLVQGLGWEQYPWPVSREWLLGGNAAEIIFDPQPAARVDGAHAKTPRLFDKTGSTNGFGAYVLFVPSEKFGLVMLANRNYPIPARVEAAYAILARLTGQETP